MQLIDPTHAKSFYTTVDVASYIDSIYARSLLQLDLGGISQTLLTSLLALTGEYRLLLANFDQTAAKLLRTAFLEDLEKVMNKTINETLSPPLKAALPTKMKMFFEDGDL